MPKPRSLTDVQVAEMVELYKAGSTQIQLAVHFGTSDSVVRKWLKRSGAETHYNVKLSEVQIAECSALYASGLSTLALGVKFGVSPQTVATALERAGVELREAGGRRRLSLRDDAFDALTSESMYWIGMLATDGNVCTSGTGSDMVHLSLKEDDLLHVEAFKSFIGSGHKIGRVGSEHPTDPSRILYRAELKVRSNRLSAALAQYGVVPQKTYTLVAKGGVENSCDFWRGAVDGDGHIGIHASNQGPDATLKFGGASEAFIEQFRSFIRANGVRGDQHVLIETPEGSLATHQKFVLKLGGAAALDAVALLYAVPAGPVLARKAVIALDMIRRGLRGELVGTHRPGWENGVAERWAAEQPPVQEMVH